MGERIAVVTANLGGFDKQIMHADQSISCDYYDFDDDNFLPRSNSMTPRLQARIPKMTSWQMVPGYDYYIWVDSSCRLSSRDSVEWLLSKLGDADIAVFKHPHRDTVQQEAEYLRERLKLEAAGKKQKYILPRYENERLDAQMDVVRPDAPLYASTAFIYRNTEAARDALSIWWMHTSLYHSIDQLSLSTAIEHAGAKVSVIDENYLNIPWLEYVRNR